MLDWVRRWRRRGRVTLTAARIYLGYKRTQRAVRKLPPEDAGLRWEDRHERAARLLYETAVSLRGLYIKSGQFIGTRSDLVPAPYIRWLSRLQDRVPPKPITVIRRVIESELGRRLEELFAEFDEEAIAAASLAQVHRARLHDGREVAVKVQYPEIADLVRLDLANLRGLVAIVARLEPNFDYRNVVRELSAQIPLELDFEREGRMLRRVAANLAHIEGLAFPEVVDELTTKRVLVTTFLHGERLFEPGSERRDGPAIARRITEAYGHQIMVDGLFQADPHPGNFLLLPDGRIGLLDFGLTKELPDRMRRGFARLVLAAAERNPAAIGEAFEELGIRVRAQSPSGVLALTQLFFDRRPISIDGEELRLRRETVRVNPVEAIPSDLVLLGRVVGLLRGVCAQLGSPLSPMEMLRPFAEQVLAEEDRTSAA